MIEMIHEHFAQLMWTFTFLVVWRYDQAIIGPLNTLLALVTKICSLYLSHQFQETEVCEVEIRRPRGDTRVIHVAIPYTKYQIMEL